MQSVAALIDGQRPSSAVPVLSGVSSTCRLFRVLASQLVDFCILVACWEISSSVALKLSVLSEKCSEHVATAMPGCFFFERARRHKVLGPV